MVTKVVSPTLHLTLTITLARTRLMAYERLSIRLRTRKTNPNDPTPSVPSTLIGCTIFVQDMISRNADEQVDGFIGNGSLNINNHVREGGEGGR